MYCSSMFSLPHIHSSFQISKSLLRIRAKVKSKDIVIGLNTLCKHHGVLQRNNYVGLESSFSQRNQTLCSMKENQATKEEIQDTSEPKQNPEEVIKAQEEFIEKINLLSKEVESYKDKYQRSLADRENLRKRLEKQISDSKLFGIQSFCKDLLEVGDVFRKALDSVPEEKIKEGESTFLGLYDGVVMTEKQLLSVFRRHGLERIIPTEGDKFDPSIQEAMFEVPESEGKVPGTVAHVVRTGWKLHDRCVRSAQVGVVKM